VPFMPRGRKNEVSLKGEKIMGSDELATNIFRASQTKQKLEREQIRGKEKANETHYEVGKKIRQTIEELGGTLPEICLLPKRAFSNFKERNKSSCKNVYNLHCSRNQRRRMRK
jgi:hypothetical protein